MNIRNLAELQKSQRGMPIKELQELVSSFTIFEKIEFTPRFTKELMKEKLHNLRTHQVPNRNVLLHMNDEDVVFYWFKNWLHPDLNHWVYPSSKDKRGCSKEQLKKDFMRDSLRFYENRQQNFKYTLQDIENYINS